MQDEIVPMQVTMEVTDKATGEKSTKEVVVDRDECNRPDTTLEGLAKLAPAFKPDGTVTAGNASKKIETKTEIAPFRETLAIDFGRGTQGVRTQNNYSGPIAIQGEGIGQAAGRSWSDAFYIYTDNDGNAIEPWHPAEFYNWTLWINGEPVDTLVSSIPEYNPDHIYIFGSYARSEKPRT